MSPHNVKSMPKIAQSPFGLPETIRSFRRVSSLMKALIPPRASFANSHPLMRANVLSHRCKQIIDSHRIEVEVCGRKPTKPAILVANHLSYLDPVIISSVIRCLPIAKSDVRSWPFFGKTLSRIKIVFVERECAQSGAIVLRRMRQLLTEGVSPLLFPEGTTTCGDCVKPFRRGSFGLAKLTGCSVVPISLRFEDSEACWIDDQDFLSHYLQQTRKEKTVVQLHFLEPMKCESNESAGEFAERVRTQISKRAIP